MNQPEQKKPILEGTDILFECLGCGKSLAIDCRGAGLNIRCPQCNSELEVPIPEGFDLSQIDSKIEANGLLPEDDDQAVVPAPTAEDPKSGDANAMQAELEALRKQTQYFSRQHGDMLKIAKMIIRQTGDLRETMTEFVRVLESMSGPQADETQQVR